MRGESDLLIAIGDAIRRFRGVREWEQKDLADKLCTSQGAISRWENPDKNERGMNLRTLVRVALVLGVDPWTLLLLPPKPLPPLSGHAGMEKDY